MLLPGFETDPAEVVLALGAFHVVAAFVLLDRRLAGGAGLRVGDQPKAVDSRLRLRVGVVQLLGTDYARVGWVREGMMRISLIFTNHTLLLIVI